VAVGLLTRKKIMIITILEKKSQDGARKRSAMKIERILDVPNNERV
jgi:hypothetical protein